MVTGHFTNESVRQHMKSFCQRLMSVHQYVSSPMSKILCEIDLKCIYKLPKEDNVTIELKYVRLVMRLEAFTCFPVIFNEKSYIGYSPAAKRLFST